jgi:predicted RNase H-like HicB family nuclease
MAYDIVMEQTGNGFSAYIPDLPGCVAAAETLEETEALLLEAVQLHLEALSSRQNFAFGFPWSVGGTTSGVAAVGQQREFTLVAALCTADDYYQVTA